MSRRFRFKFAAEFPSAKLSEQFVKVNARPDPESNKVTVTIHSGTEEWPICVSKILKHDPESNTLVSEVGDAVLRLVQPPLPCFVTSAEQTPSRFSMGIGTIGAVREGGEESLIEEWKLRGVRLESIVFGDSDYSSPEFDLELTFSYESAEYVSHCGIAKPCEPS